MSEHFPQNVGFTFDAPSQQVDMVADKWDWALAIFCDPLSTNAHLAPNNAIPSQGYEVALYNDWQTRDTELGYRLIEPRLNQFSEAVASYNEGLIKRQRGMSLLRARLAAMKRINLTEPNPALQHSKELLNSIEKELNQTTQEHEYLRNFTIAVFALTETLNHLTKPTEEHRALLENSLRLTSLSWKGRLKIKAFQQHFPKTNYTLVTDKDRLTSLADFEQSSTQVNHNLQADTQGHYYFALAGARYIPSMEISLDPVVANYLLHCLETIALLAKESVALFSNERVRYLTNSWSPVMVMLRAIVELFHFCNFEMPYQYANSYVDRDNPRSIWRYRAQDGQWHKSVDESPGDHLKQQASEIASLLILPPPFLSCQEVAELSKYCRPEVMEEAVKRGNQYPPYVSAGLARLEYDASIQLYKFHSGYELSAQLLEQLIATQPQLLEQFTSTAGGPLMTLRAMARLEAQAFNGAQEPLSDQDRFTLLGRFWRLTAKHRPLALLGQDYAKNIYKGLASFGEPPPERSSLLSVHMSSVFTQAVLGKDGKLADPLAALVLADQIRLVELLNESWAFFVEYFGLLHLPYEELVAQLQHQAVAPARELVVVQSFNSRWIKATQSIWSLIRATAPETWNFWVALNNKTSTQTLLAAEDLEGALNYLFQVVAETVRLILLLESCSPVFAERLTVSAETAGQSMLMAFTRHFNLPKLIASLDYYFDPEIRYDGWLSFILNFRRHLDLLTRGLEHNNEAKTQLELLQTAITQLDAQYSDLAKFEQLDISLAPIESQPEHLSPSLGASKQGSAADNVIDEATAANIEKICQQFLSTKALSAGQLLALVALASSKDSVINEIAAQLEPLASILAESQRVLIFSAPSVTQEVGRFLRSHGANVVSLKEELSAYLSKVEHFTTYLQQLLSDCIFSREEMRSQFAKAIFADSQTMLTFTLSSVMGATICTIGEANQDIVSQITQDLAARTEPHIPNWSPEVLILGSGHLKLGSGRVVLSSAAGHNPIFSQGEDRTRLLWVAAKTRFDLALQLLRGEQAGAHFSIEI